MAPTLRTLRESDYPFVSERVDAWWGGRPVRALVQRLFFEHFQAMSLAAEEGGRVVGFLIGFQSQTDPAVAYIHFVGVDPGARARGLGRRLYEAFFERARARGCRAAEAITSPVNHGSIAFHRAMGFALLPGDGEVDGVPVVKDHAGPGQARVRFHRVL
jgi:ribosomal protein S18 acetylase RimI-like enzyme